MPKSDFNKVAVLKIYSKFTGEHPCQSVISIKLQLCNFIEITLRHGCSPVNLLYISRTPFPKNTSGRLLLNIASVGLKLFEKTFAANNEFVLDEAIALKHKSSLSKE